MSSQDPKIQSPGEEFFFVFYEIRSYIDVHAILLLLNTNTVKHSYILLENSA